MRKRTLQRQLSTHVTAITVVAVAIACTVLTFIDAQDLSSGLRERARSYAILLARQLRSSVAFNDKLTAREVFESLDAADVAGLGLYASDGSCIEGLGEHPLALPSANSAGRDGHVVAVSAVQSREGPAGRVLVSLSRDRMMQLMAEAIVIAVSITLVALGCCLALVRRVSKHLVGRLSDVAAVADRIARGELDPPLLPCDSDDEVGQVAEAINVMASRIRQMFSESEQRAAAEHERLAQVVSRRERELERSKEELQRIVETTNATPFVLDVERARFAYVGPQIEEALGITVPECLCDGVLDRIAPRDRAAELRELLDTATDSFEVESEILRVDGAPIEVRWVVSVPETESGRLLRGLVLDVSEQRAMQRELAQAQKLESIGQLAAGIAHEINTPTQYVGDNTRFLEDAFESLRMVIDCAEGVADRVDQNRGDLAEIEEMRRALDEADVPYLREEVPRAISQSLHGIERVRRIVQSMKEFSHPGVDGKTSVDLNRAIESTITVATNEWKYVADVEMEFDQTLPPITCLVSEINQAVLNIVINAAHAIADTDRVASGGKGAIIVSTRRVGECVELRIRDNGPGIPDDVQGRIFDPFFTTKEVGRGTGQGLAIAHNIVVKRHGGSLEFQSAIGEGTSFVITLPICGLEASNPSVPVTN